jgi:hypothetical protein
MNYEGRKKGYAIAVRNWSGCVVIRLYRAVLAGVARVQSVQQTAGCGLQCLDASLLEAAMEWECKHIKWMSLEGWNNFGKMVKDCSMHNGQNGMLACFRSRKRRPGPAHRHDVPIGGKRHFAFILRNGLWEG